MSTTTSDPTSVLRSPRRVVTGHDDSGRPVLSIDHILEPQESPIMPGIVRGMNIWSTDANPATDNNDSIDGATRPVPGRGLVVPNGTNHRFTDLAPGATVPMHRTSSVDTNILVSGRLVLILDGGARTEIKPGDVVVQRGTLHTWHNPSSTEWARWLTVLIHAEPAKVDGQELEEVWQV